MGVSRAMRLWARLGAVGWLVVLAACGDPPVTPTPVPAYGTLIVTVTNQQQQPIAGATVRVVDGNNAGRTATSDPTGLAVFYQLVQSGFTIQVSASGYLTQTSSVTLTSSVSMSVTLRSAEPNRPPVISSVVAQGSRTNQPAGFADLGESIAVTASVQDNETPAGQLVFEWASGAGAIEGTGPSVTWKAPASAQTPRVVVITLTVVERWNDGGTASENRTTAQTSVNLHDSTREIADMVGQFLADFSDSSVSPEAVVRNFTDPVPSCPAGRDNELSDVRKNRATVIIQEARLGQPAVTIDFGGTCSFRSRPGDACARVSADWKSLVLSTGAIEYARGVDQVSAFYLRPRWWLCESDFDGQAPSAFGFR